MQVISIHPERLNPRELKPALEALQAGELVVYPTDTAYGVGCLCRKKGPLEKLYRLRGLSWKHPFSLLCDDVASISELAVLSNRAFKCIKRHAPGPFTFVLPAIKRIERQLNLPRKRQTIGFRLSASRVVQELLSALGEPLANMTLHHPETEALLTDPLEIQEHYGQQIAVMIDIGASDELSSTVVDLTGDEPSVIRQGAGQFEP